MRSTTLVDTAGRRRSPATLPGHHQGRPPRNKGLRYAADPPTVEEIVAVMRVAGDDADGVRLRGLIIVFWRAGLRISEALALAESDLDSSRGAMLMRHGKGDKRREVGMDRWAWEQLQPWLTIRAGLPPIWTSFDSPGRPPVRSWILLAPRDQASRPGCRKAPRAVTSTNVASSPRSAERRGDLASGGEGEFDRLALPELVGG